MSIDDNWVVNPFFRFGRMHLDGVERIHARVLRRGLGWREMTFSKDEKPRLYSLFDEMFEPSREAESDLNLDLSDDDILALRELGFLLPADEVAQAVRLVVPLPCESDAAIEEPRTRPSLDNEPPLGIELPAEHVEAGFVVWMADDDRDTRFPYWLSIGATHAQNSGASLETDDVHAPRKALEARRARRNEALSHVAAKVNNAGYAILPSLLPRAHQLALRDYFRALIAEGHVQFGDGQVDRRFGQHNEPVARLYLSLLTNVISAATSIAIKPAYAYLASYREGAVLERHRDRPQCALSVSLLIDYEPNDDAASPWPLWVAHPNDPVGVAVHQRVGDGIVYKGCELDHWRSALSQGHRSTHLFLHYVPIDFTGDLD